MSDPGLRGMLDEYPVPAVLRPLRRGKKTGPLRIARGKIGKTLYFSEGRLIFATSTDPDDRLGEMLLRKGLISYRALEESVRAIKAGKRQGTLLVESGAIRSKDLVDGVTEQVQEIIYSVFQWEEGSFEFQEGDLPSREVIVLRMSTADLIMEGVRRIQKWTRIRRGVGGLGQQYRLAADTASTLGDISLQKDEMDLIAAVDGDDEPGGDLRRRPPAGLQGVPHGVGAVGGRRARPRAPGRAPGTGRTRRSRTRSGCAARPWATRSRASTSSTASSSSW